jgi:hypothetical protein
MRTGPFAPAPVLRSDEVRRFLRLATSSEMCGDRRVPLTAIAAMTGIERRRLYEIIMGVRESECELLSQLIRQVEAGKLNFAAPVRTATTRIVGRSSRRRNPLSVSIS